MALKKKVAFDGCRTSLAFPTNWSLFRKRKRLNILDDYEYSDRSADVFLEALAEPAKGRRLGLAPWVCWESENSSFGKTLRRWLLYPKFLPLYVVTPHGAYGGMQVYPNEVDRRVRLFFGWPRDLAKARRENWSLPSLGVPHPWVFYRRKKFRDLPLNREGVIYFYPHSNSHCFPQFGSLEELKVELREWERCEGPLTICLSHHDVLSGLHRSLREWGFPLITIGTTNDIDFVDRFYSTIRNFNTVLSSSLGSQVFYASEFGINCALTESRFTFRSRHHDLEDPEGLIRDYDGPHEYQAELELFEESLRGIKSSVSPDFLKFIDWSLGLDSNRFRTRIAAIFLVWRELLRNLPDAMVRLRQHYSKQLMRRIGYSSYD